MSTITLDQPVSRAELWGGRILSGLVILFLLFDGAIKLIPLDVVTQTMDQMGYGGSDAMARALGLMVWGGLWLRDRRLRALLPLR